jgi:hypothetical protein
MYLAIDALFANTPGDKLGVLRAEIEDYYGFVMQNFLLTSSKEKL